MTTRGKDKDKWQRLPNVVAQLQAEAANPASSRPLIPWPDEPVRADEARPTAHGELEHERRPPAPGTAARAVRPRIPALREGALDRAVDRAPASEPTPVPARRESAVERPSTNERMNERMNERAPASEQIEWGGLSDYDRLAADPRPDLRALGQLLGDACARSCGERTRSIERLLVDVNRRIDKLLTEPDAENLQTQRQALCKLLDRIEDLLASLTGNSR